MRTQIKVGFSIQLVLCALTFWMSSNLMAWRVQPAGEIARSPDARHIVETLALQWSFLNGACVGLAVGLVLLLQTGYREASTSTFRKTASWLLVIVPPLIIVGHELIFLI